MSLSITHLGKYYPPAPGGIETHVQTLARGQAACGARVQVVCVNHLNRQGADVVHDRYGTTETVRDTDGPIRITRLGRSATVARLDMCPDLLNGLNEAIDSDADAMHLHTPNPTMMLALLRTRRHIPLFVTHHSDVVKQRLLRHALSPLEHLIYGRAARIFVTSQAYADGSALLQRFNHKIDVLPMGLELKELLNPSEAVRAAEQRWRDAIGEPLWLAVGRCVYYKGFEHAVKALRDVPGKLLVIGSGPLTGELKALAERTGVGDRIVWKGFAKRDELLGAYLAATALWFPSTHRSEAFGLVQVEAMASGCPVINTNIAGSGVAWVSRHEETGLTIPVADAPALAAASRRLLQEPELRTKLSQQAVRRAVEQFDHRLMASRSIALYDLRQEPKKHKHVHELKDWVRQMARQQPLQSQISAHT